MLQSILAEFATEDRPAITAVVGRYVARLTRSREFNQQIKAFGKHVPTLRATKHAVLDRHAYFLTRLWRAVYEHVRYGIRVELLATEFRVSRRDISTVLGTLTERDRQRIIHSRIGVDYLAAEQREHIVDEIRKSARRLAQRKLRFIARYDSGISLEDLEADLAAEGVRTFLYYEHFGPTHLAKILNYVRISVHNRCINLIHHYCTIGRAAVKAERGYRCVDCSHTFDIRVGPPPAQCPKCASDNLIDQTKEREYVVTKISLDDCLRDKQRAHEIEAQIALPQERSLTTDELLHRLDAVADPRVREFFNIINGRVWRFARWLYRIHGKPSVTALTLAERGEYAREYLGLTVSELVQQLHGVLDPEVLAYYLQRHAAATDAL
jgi:DNA-directed RNA polymerase subunit RPC12/RpoP